jgi:hypothetical protein
MAVITLNDLPKNRALDLKAMAATRGAGGAWVLAAFRPFARSSSSCSSITNLYQIENNYYQIDNSVHVDKMINQFQTVAINNSGNNSPINAVLLSSLNS